MELVLLIQSIKTVREHISESEMEGTIDKDDSYYPTWIALGDLLEKLIDESAGGRYESRG